MNINHFITSLYSADTSLIVTLLYLYKSIQVIKYNNIHIGDSFNARSIMICILTYRSFFHSVPCVMMFLSLFLIDEVR